jgi:hypothetical protein
MSILPGEKLRYAETHFKFKLPWSLLYRPWPEIFTDAPFQFVPGEHPLLWIGVRDGDRFPVTIESVELDIRKVDNGTECAPSDAKTCALVGEKSRTQEVRTLDRLNLAAKNAFDFFPVEIGNLEPGRYEITPKVVVVRNGKKKVFKRWNFPGLKPAPLKIQVLAEELPKAPGFAVGEMHCHTCYSADHVEYGASTTVMQQAAKAIGLDFVNFTDHAYDFAFLQEDYTREAPSAPARFQELKQEIAALPQSPLLIAGEEVSAGNSKGENVHMTVLGPEGYLPGLGDCGRYWLSNRPTLPIAKLLEMADAPCFAAHPLQQMGMLEKFIFRRGYWKNADLHLNNCKNPVRGIQFWNGIRDEGFKLGRAWWIEELGKGNYLLPIGGNDAHGDLNDTTFVKLPLFSLGHNRHHVFGRVRTAIQTRHPEQGAAGTAAKDPDPQTLTQEKLKAAFAGDNCYVTDGPALWWERSGAAIVFHARSNGEMGGGFRYIRIYGRRRIASGLDSNKMAAQEEVLPESLVAASQNETITVQAAGFAYLRAECETATGRFALTSAAIS